MTKRKTLRTLNKSQHPVKLGDGPSVASFDATNKHIHAALEYQRSKFEAGDNSVILEAVGDCAAWGLPMPRWLADAFGNAYSKRWNDRRVMKSWNEVFGEPWPKGTKPGEIQRQRNTLWAYARVKELREEEMANGQQPVTPINELFEKIGKEATPVVSAAVVSRWFYAVAKLLQVNHPIPGLSQQNSK